jgi:ribosomal protein S18 acetylase RimI-like enzyme
MNRPASDISEVSAADFAGHIETLSALLLDAVDHGASIGFVPPFGLADAQRFWHRLLAPLDRGARRLFIARDGHGIIVGTVQLGLDVPANGAHRAEINKLMVHTAARQQGHAAALMLAAETCARGLGKSLLVLDTISDSVAQALYTRLGFQLSGRIPAYALSTGGVLEPTSVMYKLL